MNVLLVEDDAPLADVIARNVRARGHGLTIAATAEGAVLAMAEAWPDVVVLDVNLPDLTGWEILRRMSVEDRQRVAVIVISAAPISEKRMVEFRPQRALQKPFPIEALVRMLNEVAPTAENA
ncbi:MAG TPA: response regulator [Dehalococcoidia bacterium]|nr:response regulator [Dehalococcoidia bacterium]